jgi:uncharacterized protein (TIGR01777 family)
MKIIVTGATGFIGRSLIGRCIVEGHEVVALTRDAEKAAPLFPAGVKVLTWDGATAGDWVSEVDGADAVVNLAGEPIAGKRWTAAQKTRIIESRVCAARAIRDAIAKARRKPSVLVNSSAVGYYGPVAEGDVAEDRHAGKGFLAETCVRWEAEASAIGSLGPRVAMLRIGVVLGEKGGALEKIALPFKLFAGGPIGSGSQWFPWVHRDDVVGIAMFAIGNPGVAGPINAVAPESVTMKTFCAAVGTALRRPSWAPVPAPVLRLALGEMAEMLLTGQRVVPARLSALGYQFKFPTLARALTDLFPEG